MPKYNYKDDAMTAYMKGKISAKELDKISKEDFKSSVATKQELQNFLKSGYMKELMANTYGLKVPAMEKKVKELMRFAESMQFEGMFSTIDQIRQDSKDVRDFVKNVFADRDFKKMKNDKDFIKYLKSVYEGFASDAQRRAAFASGYKAKGKKKESISDHPKASWKDKDMDEKLDNDDIPVVKNIITKLKGASKKHAKQADDLEKAVNEISAEGGLKRVIKGQTREVEGIKVSKEMAQAMLDWFNSSPYGRKYPKAKKGRLHISIGIMLSFGLERYAKHKGAKQELKYLKSISKTLSKKDPRESVNEGNKRYNQKDGVGKSKYVISYHDGKKKHKDGSDFFDIQIFRNKKDLAKFVNTLHKGGYKYGFDESVNEAAIKGQNRKTGETFGMVIGSDKKNKEGNFELTIRVMYSSRISSYKLTFNSNNELINILDYGYSMDGRPPDMKGSGSGKSVKADKRKTIIFIAKLTSPAFANKIYKHLQKVNESVNEAFVVAYGKGPKPIKPAFAAYADKKMAQKFMGDMKKDGYKVMMTQKKIKGVDESVNESKTKESKVVQMIYKYEKKEKKFYDKMAEHERRIGSREYKMFIAKALRGFGLNPNKFKSIPDAEEKLYQTVSQ